MTKQIRRSWAIGKARMVFGLRRVDQGTWEQLAGVGIALILSLAVLVPLSASGASVETVARALGF
jgi:hypothetical protein